MLITDEQQIETKVYGIRVMQVTEIDQAFKLNLVSNV